MLNMSFVAKNKKHRLTVEKGQDVLLALDIFLKNNKLDFTCLKNVKMRCLCPQASPNDRSVGRDSVSCRIGKIIAFVLNKA